MLNKFIQTTNNDITASLRAVTSYTVTYTSSSITPSQFVSCEEAVCNYTVAVPATLCSATTDANVSITAVNRIGQGPPSDAVTVGIYVPAICL